ncbi:MAG: phosphopantetheine-binding protein [Azonexus sp.]
MNPLHEELKAFIIDAMNLEDMAPDDIGDDMPLFADEGLGLDSIDALELVLGLKKRYGLTIEAGDETARQHLRSIRTLAALITARQQG